VSFHDHTICVVGLGYVGVTLASAFADVGFTVHGTEIRPDVLADLQAGRPHVHEPGLADAVERQLRQGQLVLSDRIPDGCRATVYIITVGTPLDPQGRVRLDMIADVAREVSEHLREGDMVILRSTVKIGTTRSLIAPILDKAGVRFDLAFCPERTLEGQALAELRTLPQIVGALTAAAAMRATQLFQMLTPTVVRVADPETAEMIKLVSNAHRDVEFAYSNEIARMCDDIGISAAEVIAASKVNYPRTRLPLPGPVGGPCLSKDSHILAESFAQSGTRPEITIAARAINERQPEECAAFIESLCGGLGVRCRKVALLGLAFKGKPATADLRGSMAIPIFQALQVRLPSARFLGFDPVLEDDAVKGCGIEPSLGIEDAFDAADLVVIMNNHVAFETMALGELAATMSSPGVIYDFWNHFTGRTLELPHGVRYVALGSHKINRFAARLSDD
jgi:UDP-N-acetyl-D-mannosaminuronic acid dehydrogenase